MLYSGTDPESYITEYTLVHEEKTGDVIATLTLGAVRIDGFSLCVVLDASFRLRHTPSDPFYGRTCKYAPGLNRAVFYEEPN